MEPMDRLNDLIAAGRREWSDDLEAVAGILGAAGVWDNAVGRRRQFARDLLRRGVSPCDVLTWAMHGLTRGNGAGWLVRALEADPETIWKARSKKARQRIAGNVNHIRTGQVASIVASVLERMAQRLNAGEVEGKKASGADGDKHVASRRKLA